MRAMAELVRRAPPVASIAMSKRTISTSSRSWPSASSGRPVTLDRWADCIKSTCGCGQPALRTANTWKALDALRATGLLTPEEHATLRASYDFLRGVESRLRIVHNLSLDELPEAPEDLEKLARRLGLEATPQAGAGSQ